MMARILPICMICRKVPKRGIAAGISVCGSFICSECERQMLESRFHNIEALKELSQKLV